MTVRALSPLYRAAALLSLTASLCLTALPLAAQDAPLKLNLAGTSGPFTVFNEMKGFTKGGIRVHFREDARGTIWAWSQKGLWRFNGTRFEKADTGALRIGGVRDLHCDAAGSVWVATDDELVRFDGASWKRIGEADGLGYPVVWSIVRGGDGVLWFNTEKNRHGVYRYENGSFTRIDPSGIGDIDTIEYFGGNDLFIVNGRDCYRRGNDNVFTLVKKDLFPKKILGMNTADVIMATTRSGALWYAVDGTLAVWENGAFKKINGIDIGSAWSDRRITDLHEDRQGRMLVSYGDIGALGNKKAGVFVVDGETVADIPMSDKKDVVCNIFSDSTGTVWYSALHGCKARMLQYDGTGWRIVFDADEDMTVTSVFEDSSRNLWIGTTPVGRVVLYRRQ